MRFEVFLFAVLAALPAAAQTPPWFDLDPARGFGRGAAVCETPDPVTGNGGCLVLRCMPGAPLEWSLVAVGGDFGTGPFTATVQVDGGIRFALPLAPTGRTDVQEAAGPVDAARDAALLAALRDGRVAVVTAFGTATAYALRGSGRAIGRAQAACPAARAAPAALPPAALPGTMPGALTAEAVRARLIGVPIVHETEAGEAGFRFDPGGTFDSVVDGRAGAGAWSLQPGGLVCWEFRSGIAGCFRYYEDAAGMLRVKREDPGSDAELGTVTVLSR